MPANTGSLLIL